MNNRRVAAPQLQIPMLRSGLFPTLILTQGEEHRIILQRIRAICNIATWTHKPGANFYPKKKTPYDPAAVDTKKTHSHHSAATWTTSRTAAAADTASSTSTAFLLIRMHHLRFPRSPSPPPSSSTTNTCFLI